MKLTIIDALEDIKTFNITVMDIRKLTEMTSYMIVTSANSTHQTKTIADNVREKLKTKNTELHNTENDKENE